ncbi:DUF5959 family protein [Streptomyces tirandamycinicus]|uniref:DUF5959 family protein n=1 Tax=Streptomyces tirandamycinicus TaxID=2174846 RepID=UPI00226FD757|nr:DUF5959 family protein [Streptomyces tirandamycinicus]MCY0982386.1 DUF5959 family protein [Streptomyces tirandamycinicus]
MTESGEPVELIRLDDGVQSVAVRVLSREGDYCDAEIVIESDFVNATVRTGFDADDIRAWGSLLDAVEEDEYDEEDDSVFAGDWPQEGRTAYLTFAADDPYVVEVRDAPSTRICVRVPLDLGGDWITEARERHAAARQALGV